MSVFLLQAISQKSGGATFTKLKTQVCLAQGIYHQTQQDSVLIQLAYKMLHLKYSIKVDTVTARGAAICTDYVCVHCLAHQTL